MSTPDLANLTVNGTAIQTSKTGDVPFIKYTKRPTFKWEGSDADNDPLTYILQIYWDGVRDVDGDPTIVPSLDLQVTGLPYQYYTPRAHQALPHVDNDDAGGDYRMIVTASDGTNTKTVSGWFKVNHIPGIPTGLRVI